MSVKVIILFVKNFDLVKCFACFICNYFARQYFEKTFLRSTVALLSLLYSKESVDFHFVASDLCYWYHFLEDIRSKRAFELRINLYKVHIRNSITGRHLITFAVA